MKTITRTMYYPTFNEQTNAFDYEEIDHERPATDKERRANLLLDAIYIAGIILLAITLLGFIVCSVVNWSGANVIFFIAFLVSLGSCLVVFPIAEKRLSPILDWAPEVGFDAEILEWEQIVEEQNIRAEEWRKAHPLEEAIRKAQLSKNCVDIAQVIKSSHLIHDLSIDKK